MEREQDTSCKQIHGTGRVEAAEKSLTLVLLSLLKVHELDSNI